MPCWQYDSLMPYGMHDTLNMCRLSGQAAPTPARRAWGACCLAGPRADLGPARAQVVQLFDSWAHHLSPDQYAEFSLPNAERLVAAERAARPGVPLIYHANGGAPRQPPVLLSCACAVTFSLPSAMLFGSDMRLCSWRKAGNLSTPA